MWETCQRNTEARVPQQLSIFRSGVRGFSSSSGANSSCANVSDNSEAHSYAQHSQSRGRHRSKTYPIFGVDGNAPVDGWLGRESLQVARKKFGADHFDDPVRSTDQVKC